MKLTDIIKNYVEQSDTDFAIMINGQWGSGKTFFLKNEVTKFVGSIKYEQLDKKIKSYELVYVSLYGITTADEIQKRLFVEVNPFLKKKIRKVGLSVLNKGLQYIGIGADKHDQKDLVNYLMFWEMKLQR